MRKHPRNCLLPDWGEWGHCRSHESQRYQSRAVTQHASNGGKECGGHLEETASCSAPPPPILPCTFSNWAAWSVCTQTCGGGLRTLERQLESPAANGGALCEGKLQELSMCGTAKCEIVARRDCLVGDGG